MDVYTTIAERIIKQQESIIGPVALEQAQQVSGLQVGQDNHVQITGKPGTVINNLVTKYKDLFGQISVEVCKEATEELVEKMPPQEVPSLLR